MENAEQEPLNLFFAFFGCLFFFFTKIEDKKKGKRNSANSNAWKQSEGMQRVMVQLNFLQPPRGAGMQQASWELSSILPIIPVAVLTLGFHVITPFMCKIAGNTVHEARKAILIGGAIPLVMVLSWNLIVLGLVGSTNKGTNFGGDPISLLLSVNPSALSAVQGFAFSAMATSLIGYAVSLPKQILDTLELVFGKGAAASSRNLSIEGSHEMRSNDEETFDAVKVFVTLLVLGFSVLIASYFRSTFSRALDFAGVYANCFLFGIIPPVMAYIQQSKKKIRSSSVPGGNVTLLLLFIISVILGIWH